MKFISWNVNGIRSVLRQGLLDFLKKEKPDFFCAQETKAPSGGFHLNLAGYHEYWNHARRPGYSGVLILSKSPALSIRQGIGVSKHDSEGRVLTAEYPDFFLVCVYVPNSKRDLSRLKYRSEEWDVDFLKYLQKLEKKKPVVFCGDLNVAHREVDLTNPKANVKNHGFTPEERRGFDRLVDAGFIDTFREFEAGGGFYTWWSRFANCRKRNIGWRIDYFCVSKKLRPRLKKARIYQDVQGSDHCPVGLELKGIK